MPITLNGDTGITTPGLTNTGSTTLVSLTTTGNTILGDQSTDTLNVANGNLVLNSSGNLGIGTASPIGVANYQGITIGGTNGGLIRFQSGASTQNAQIAANTSGLEIECVNTGIPIKFYTGGSLRATLDSSGNLGIGTASPAARLDVVSSSYPNFITNRSLSTGGSGSNAWTAAQLKVTTTEQMSAGFGVQQEFVLRDADAVDNIVAAFVVLRDGADNSGALSFRTAAAGTLTERARITSAGNVGIGTTSPSSILTLSQAQAPITTFWGSARADGNPYTAGGIESTFVTRDGVPALGGFIRILDVNTFGAFPTTIRGGAITFGTVDGLSGQGVNATERARIDSSGGLSIGTTASAGAGNIILPGSSGTIFANTTNSSRSYIELYNNSTGDMSIATTFATASIRFLTGGTTTPTERARITSGGNFGIGTTSPAQRLDVSSGDSVTRIAVTNTANAANGSGLQFLVLNGGTEASNVTIRADNADNTQFFNKGGERARIDASGNLLVGTTSFGSTAVGFGISGNTSSSSRGACISVINSSVNGNTTYEAYSLSASAYRFYVGMGGTVYATSTTITAISDQRLKENIRDLDEGLATVMALKPRKFDWKAGKGADIKNARGFIAQEFEAVLPDMIETWRDPAPEGEEPYKAINANLIPTLVKAIQELKSELDSVKTELAALKGN